MSEGEPLVVGPGTVDLDVLDNTLSFFIRGLNIAVTRDWESRLEGLDIIRGAGRVTALFLIDRHPGIRASAIARIAIKDRSETARMLDGLAAGGLIERRLSPVDSRARELFLTPEGVRVVGELRARVKASWEYFSDISPEDTREVLTLLRRIYWRIVLNPRPGKDRKA